VDRATTYKDTCIKEGYLNRGVNVEMIADVQLEKGWNFIKSELLELQKYGEKEEEIMQKKRLFTANSPRSVDVKWFITRRMEDDKILLAKKEFELHEKR